MKRAYRIIRFILVTLLSVAVGLPILLYLLLSIPGVHHRLKHEATEYLTELLGAEVNIGSLNVVPFNRVELSGIDVVLSGDTVLTASQLNAGISMSNLLVRRRVVVTDVELMRPDIRIKRDSAGGPLNVQPIIDNLKGDGKKEPAKFDLAVHTVVIRSGRVTYDVLNAEPRDGFDRNHIALNELRADITAPRINNDEIRVSLKRLNFQERGGMILRNLAADVVYTPERVCINGMQLRFDRSNLNFEDVCFALKGSRHLTDVEILQGSELNPADFAPFCAPLANVDETFAIAANIELFADSLDLKRFSLSAPNRLFDAAVKASATGNEVSGNGVALAFDAPKVVRLIDKVKPLKPHLRDILTALGNVTVTGTASWRRPADVALAMDVSTDVGDIVVDADVADQRLRGVIDAIDFNLGIVNADCGVVSASSTFDLSQRKGNGIINIDRLDWRGYSYRGIDVDGRYQDKVYAVNVTSADSLACFDLAAEVDLTPGAFAGELAAEISNFAPNELGLWAKYPGYTVAGHINGEFVAEELLRPSGQLRFTNLCFTDSEGNGLREAPMTLTAALDAREQTVSFTSDLIDLKAQGQINLATLPLTVNNILAKTLPASFTEKIIPDGGENDFSLSGTIHKDAPLLEFVKFPMKFLYAISIDGELHQKSQSARLAISAPYIQNGDKLIEGTKLNVLAAKKTQLRVNTKMPSKFGLMDLELNSTLSGGQGHASFRLNTPGEDAYSGVLNAYYRPAIDGVDVQIEESAFNLGEKDMKWTLRPALIAAHGGRVAVHGLTLSRPGQRLSIRGVASKSSDDVLTVNLRNINLDNVFEALRMNTVVQFGGTATGTITGAGLFSSEPILQTEDLTATNFSYAHCLMGDASIKARWNHETRGIELHADVEGNIANGRTVVDGVIKPMTQELDFNFYAKHTPIGFLHTFMESWASKVSGYASGNAHLWGTFKFVELEGDMFAENFALTVDYTNTTYYATDSVHISPGIIKMQNMTLRDADGHTARLNGRLTHNKFQDPVFNFRITNIDRLLAYNRPVSLDDFWGGTIYANGAVTIEGRPGRVGISAVLATAPGSDFTIELSDKKQATEYNFLTFRDVTPRAKVDSTQLLPGTTELDKIMREKVRKQVSAQSSSIYDFDLQVKVTPDVKMTAVMDPVSDDRIVAYGQGDIGIKYTSQTDEMRLDGTYRLDRGEYNFSLQDIIRKNFTIKEGSSITFKGDPYDAKLDIAATYQRHANLSDLDESFLTDKEVQRTSVPVNAVLLVQGSIESPEIGFDLEFPTLHNSDVPNKVKSIVNTNEMMQQQIIYLLALDRFYTPEYMSATKGNELMSVASGTISSQLSNILGQLSDKLSVAPSVRADAGDFSDMEVDVALSSTLLNNRLLLNGNFGYRDNSLNTATTQFVGDLDVEYLLTRAGNWRLKAYNHFNDRNLYVKTALTTQGVGLVFKHDFDHLFRTSKKNVSESNNGGAR